MSFLTLCPMQTIILDDSRGGPRGTFLKYSLFVPGVWGVKGVWQIVQYINFWIIVGQKAPHGLSSFKKSRANSIGPEIQLTSSTSKFLYQCYKVSFLQMKCANHLKCLLILKWFPQDRDRLESIVGLYSCSEDQSKMKCGHSALSQKQSFDSPAPRLGTKMCQTFMWNKTRKLQW